MRRGSKAKEQHREGKDKLVSTYDIELKMRKRLNVFLALYIRSPLFFAVKINETALK